MSSRIDDKFAALRTLGHVGAMSDMTLQWLQANGATAKAVSDAWAEMLASKGFAPQRSDSWYALMGSLGYTGSVSDREAAFWVNGGVFTAPVNTLPAFDEGFDTGFS